MIKAEWTNADALDLRQLATDCINRQAAIDVLRVAYWDDNIQSAKDDPCIVDAMTDWAIRQVKALPPVQPERKKGKWICDGDCFICSECKSAFNWWARSQCSNFCPNCGADMMSERRR